MGTVLCCTWVPGVPRTKGSLDDRMQDSPASKAWRSVVASEVARYMRVNRPIEQVTMPAFDGPVAVRCVFVVPPRSLTDDRGIDLGVGDVDKLARNVLDAISIDAKLIVDDVQVVRLVCDRVVGDRVVGLALTVAALDAADVENVRSAAFREVLGARR